MTIESLQKEIESISVSKSACFNRICRSLEALTLLVTDPDASQPHPTITQLISNRATVVDLLTDWNELTSLSILSERLLSVQASLLPAIDLEEARRLMDRLESYIEEVSSEDDTGVCQAIDRAIASLEEIRNSGPDAREMSDILEAIRTALGG